MIIFLKNKFFKVNNCFSLSIFMFFFKSNDEGKKHKKFESNLETDSKFNQDNLTLIDNLDQSIEVKSKKSILDSVYSFICDHYVLVGTVTVVIICGVAYWYFSGPSDFTKAGISGSDIENHPDQGVDDFLQPVQENLVDKSQDLPVLDILNSQEIVQNDLKLSSSINENLFSVDNLQSEIEGALLGIEEVTSENIDMVNSILNNILNLKPIYNLSCEELLFVAKFDIKSFYNLDFGRIDPEILEDVLMELPPHLFDWVKSNWDLSFIDGGVLDLLEDKEISQWSGEDLAMLLSDKSYNLFDLKNYLLEVSKEALNEYGRIVNFQIAHNGKTNLPTKEYIQNFLLSSERLPVSVPITNEVNPFLSAVRPNLSEQVVEQVSNIVLSNPDVTNQAVEILSNNNPFLF